MAQCEWCDTEFDGDGICEACQADIEAYPYKSIRVEITSDDGHKGYATVSPDISEDELNALKHMIDAAYRHVENRKNNN